MDLEIKRFALVEDDGLYYGEFYISGPVEDEEKGADEYVVMRLKVATPDAELAKLLKGRTLEKVKARLDRFLAEELKKLLQT